MRTLKHILHFSDVHLNISKSLDLAESAALPIRYGQDAPLRLLESALAFAKQVLPQPELFLYTGDHVAHGEHDDAYVAKAVELNVQMMHKYFPPTSTRTLDATAILGNNDANPNYFMELTNAEAVANPTIAKVSGAWNDSLSSSDLTAFKRRGFLSYALGDKAVVLTLNTVPYAPKHTPNTQNVEDPFGQFAWLESTLASLKASGKVAYIAGHIPPVVDSFREEPQWFASYIETYKRIVGKYADVVKAQFFGHVQSVEVRVPLLKSTASGAVPTAFSTADETYQLVPLFLSGSISPYFINNPSFIVWDYDATTFEVVDFTVYGTNISEKAEQALDWQPLFKGSEAYGLQSLSTGDLSAFYERVKTDPELLDAYYWNTRAQSRRFEPCASDLCRATTLCAMKWWSTKSEYSACVDGVQSNIRNRPVAATPPPRIGGATNGNAEHQTPPGDSSVAVIMIALAAAVVAVVAIAI
ncbi:hypothetical protein PybrP1_011283, partial [[Pythium] brassicae (nom. inval.)]